VICDGDCIVHGTLSASAVGTMDGPGAVTLGIGAPGSSCLSFCIPFGCFCFGHYFPQGPGVHHGNYGSAIPFSLLGGSPGGSMVWRGSSYPQGFVCCDLYSGMTPGGGGGGTLAVIASGVIDIDGIVDVRGSSSGSVGSAGSLLLRGDGGMLLRPSGQVLADGPGAANGGEVRLDAWGALPVVQGTILAPNPRLVALPHLRAASPPAIGATWSIDVFAPTNAIVFLAAATQRGLGLPTAFGTLDIDLASGAIVGPAPSSTGHDPSATFAWAIPNLPQLIGAQVWLQGLAWPATLAPRLTNAISAIVQ
jgi:hypothetical protein